MIHPTKRTVLWAMGGSITLGAVGGYPGLLLGSFAGGVLEKIHRQA
jgi:hypothetical protein